METMSKEKNEFLKELNHLLNKANLLDVPLNLTIEKEKRITKEAKSDFVLMFTKNALKAFLDLNKSEQIVLVALTNICNYGNVWQVTHQALAEETRLARPTVSNCIKTLKSKGYLLKDPDNGMEFINPFLFLKGSMDDFMKSNAYKKILSGGIKLADNKPIPFFENKT
jgi:hypothetical protein